MGFVPRQLVFLLAATSLAADEPALSEVFKDDFAVGVALGSRQVAGRNAGDAMLAAKHFNSLTPENDMKWHRIQPQPGRYNFGPADACIKFAEDHDMEVIGHTLVWHSQTPRWVFVGEEGNPVTREQLLERMRDHIQTVAGRYQGKIKGWDVVNEALSDGGGDILRDSPWRRIIGDDYIDQAFRFAREADPEAELYYNDYNLENPRKRANCIELVKGMIERGVPIDGIGTQSHLLLDSPSLEDIEKTIEEFSALGVKVMITELEVDVLPRDNPGVADITSREQGANPYTEGLPREVQMELAQRYSDIFGVYLRHRDAVTRVTFWGLHDGRTWLNHFPVRGRTNHPLLFDRDREPKPAFHAVIEREVGRSAKIEPSVPVSMKVSW